MTNIDGEMSSKHATRHRQGNILIYINPDQPALARIDQKTSGMANR